MEPDDDGEDAGDDGDDANAALAEFHELAERIDVKSTEPWSRDDLYEDRRKSSTMAAM